MWPRRLIHDIRHCKPVLNLYFQFQFFIRKLDKSLYRIKSVLILDTHTNVTSLCKQKCKQRDFLADGADLIDRRET